MKRLLIILTLIVLSACSPQESTHKSPGINNLQTITDMGIAID